MAGLIVAGYDAVHKQGQVFKLSLKDIKSVLFAIKDCWYASFSRRCGACPLAACACASPWPLEAPGHLTSMEWWTTPTGWATSTLLDWRNFLGEHASEGMRGLGPAGCHTGLLVICVISSRLSYLNLLLTGNQEGWQLRRMLQDGNYHQGKNQSM